MIKWLRTWFGGGALSNADKGAQSTGPDSHTTEAGIVLTDERAMQISAVWSCARILTETVSSLPIAVYQRTPTGRVKAEDHYLYDLLRVSPNSMMNPQEFREALQLSLVLWGNAYAFIERDNTGKPISITPLKPERMTPSREGGEIVYYYKTSGPDERYRQAQILHIKGMSIDGVAGLSPLAYARNTMGITASADRYASHSFNKKGRPSGVVTVDRVLTPAQRDALREIYNNIEAGGTEILEGGTKYNAIDIPPDDMQMLQSRQFQLGEIARIFRVPSYLINDTEKSTSWGTGIEQQNLGFLTYTIRPYLTRWETAIVHSLLSRTDRRKYFVEHNVEGLLRADSAARANFYSIMAQNGIMSRNEIRMKENLPPKDGADDLTVQVNLTPVADLPGLANGNQNTPV